MSTICHEKSLSDVCIRCCHLPMAEVIAILGVISSVVGVAAEGLKLSQTLNTYIESVKFAEKDIQGIARDVKHTAVVLNQFGENLKLEEKTRGVVDYLS